MAYSWIKELAFSPDSQRVAYAAKSGERRFTVVDGKEEKSYDTVRNGALVVFSPDSKRVAYVAVVGKKRSVVVDGEVGKTYDEIPKGSRIVFDSPDRFHYLAMKGSRSIYLVEEELK